jgi:hypothetical protein
MKQETVDVLLLGYLRSTPECTFGWHKYETRQNSISEKLMRGPVVKQKTSQKSGVMRRLRRHDCLNSRAALNIFLGKLSRNPIKSPPANQIFSVSPFKLQIYIVNGLNNSYGIYNSL